MHLYSGTMSIISKTSFCDYEIWVNIKIAFTEIHRRMMRSKKFKQCSKDIKIHDIKMGHQHGKSKGDAVRKGLFHGCSILRCRPVRYRKCRNLTHRPAGVIAAICIGGCKSGRQMLEVGRFGWSVSAILVPITVCAASNVWGGTELTKQKVFSD